MHPVFGRHQADKLLNPNDGIMGKLTVFNRVQLSKGPKMGPQASKGGCLKAVECLGSTFRFLAYSRCK